MLALKPEHVNFINFVFVIPAMIYSSIVFRLWSRQVDRSLALTLMFSLSRATISTSTSSTYAYLMAIKDKLLGTTAIWVPSGDLKAHEGVGKAKGGNNKYRNSRILCALSTFHVLQGFRWYNYLPSMILDAITIFISFRFIWST
ncbi:hypothetical protein C8R43DRAFT_700911 [Mycena crocata]|nr:hypothetical protein C8R43DRAFT_700911 [Mycena crocata]